MVTRKLATKAPIARGRRPKPLPPAAPGRETSGSPRYVLAAPVPADEVGKWHPAVKPVPAGWDRKLAVQPDDPRKRGVVDTRTGPQLVFEGDYLVHLPGGSFLVVPRADFQALFSHHGTGGPRFVASDPLAGTSPPGGDTVLLSFLVPKAEAEGAYRLAAREGASVEAMARACLAEFASPPEEGEAEGRPVLGEEP